MGAKSKGRIPRNKKKSWKKQVDISEVDEYLDDVRLQERFGGLVSEKESDEIFTIDKSPDEVDPDVLLRQKRPKRPKVDQDNLRCFQNLKGLPGAKVPVKHNYIKDKRPEYIKAKTNRKKAASKLLAAVSNDIALKKGEEKKKQLPKDPWADDETADPAGDWLEPALRKMRRCRTEGTVRRPLYMRVKRSLLPAVEPPHAGQSYHPEAADHSALLEEAVLVEHKKEADFQRWERQTTAKFPSRRPTEADWIKEMSGGLGEDEEEKGDDEKSVTLVKKVPKPKTRQQRRKMREREVAERQRLAAVTTRRSENEVFRVRTIAKELRAREARTVERQARRLERQCARAIQPLTLGRERFEPTSLELNLTEELPGSLRNIRVEGDPLQERFKSLQKRNIIEPRVRTTQKKKFKRKRFDRITASDREPNKLKTERNF
ncbi:ribosome biogenesis protein NOP53-like [Amphibalanus amphitrite]|uniref:ribosome biogenesis protein NOP53-like n=1 Tax=Amphibalanus amphitrite TaxID=1232801 RepID=UPI001C8FADA2|nr:ribosome biogenesis protein NOP53-like [Amphibalanus amphitrite]XP_043221412.1 ribosome biogenesis protein NOP53-like [Amphibalanus amphitrite]XP_043221413.1 ribosome biogenesis protein NOP53-like [Amphibalanus amphitrite]